MPLRRFVEPLDPAALRYHLGGLLWLAAALQLPPLVLALAVREWPQAGALAAAAGLGAAAAALLRWGERPGLELREALVVTALAYLAYAALGAIPYLTVTGPVPALFEAMSGISTTGLSLLDADALPASLELARSLAQWLGGAGIVVISLVVLAGPGRAAFALYVSDYGQDNLLGNVVATARVVTVAYGALTGVALAAYLVTGVPPFEAVQIALTTVSTGGFAPRGDSLASYSAPARAVAGGLMLLSAVSLPLYVLAWRGDVRRLLRDVQLRALLVLAASALALWWLAEGLAPGTLLEGWLQGVSALSTTGFASLPATAWNDSQVLLLLTLMVVGGSTGATVGGIKLLRVLIALRLAGWAALRSLLPSEAVVPVKLGGVAIGQDEIRRTLGLIAAYALAAVASALVLTLAGAPLGAAVFDSVSALSTVGLSLGAVSPELPWWAQLTLTVGMWLGRLEILPVLVLLTPNAWRNG